jgi:tetratricopeptide (TPR) repeat protein
VKPWEEQYDNSVQQVAQAVHDYAGPVEGIDFLVRRVETLPEWARYANNRGWDQHSNALAAWLREVRNLPPLPGLPAALDARLLTLVVAELTDDLTTRAGRNRTLYYAPYAYYWAEKEPAFAAAAEAVLAAHPDSVATRLYVANYLFHGCNRRGRAIDVLKELHAAGKLDTGGRSTLAGYLLETERFAEADGVLAPLVADQPDVIEHRTRLMTAYFRLGKPAELRDLYSKSLLRWREKNLWTTGAMAQFAAAAQACDMHREAADLYAELIPTVQRNTVTPNGQLAEFYRRYSLSLSAICKHVEAVDAAGGAIVAWGGDLNNRRQAILALNHAVARAGDLTPLVAHFDKQTAETGLVNPVVRKALGEAYRARQDYAPAATQLELALDGQPNDAETFGLLVDTYDKLNRKADAVGRILDALQLTPRDLDRYAELGKRYAEGGDAAVAERAFTSLVEVTRGEADGLMKLAARYQEQGRWAAAIPLWEQAAANRPLEPAGLLGLAGAQIEAKRFADARATIAKLKAKAWPAHAGDTPKAVAELEAKLSK